VSLRKTRIEGIIGGILAIIAVLSMCAIPLGWLMNVYALTQTDFASPYKEEAFRTLGVVIPPVGVVMGYIPMDDGPPTRTGELQLKVEVQDATD